METYQTIYLNNKDKTWLIELAKKSHISVSAYCRMILFKDKPEESIPA